MQNPHAGSAPDCRNSSRFSLHDGGNRAFERAIMALEGALVAGRASVVLREQFEAAERDARAHGSLASIVEVRANVDVAIRVTREKLRAIRQLMTPAERAAEAADTGPRSEERFLEDELTELARLREHMKVLLGTMRR